MLWERGFIDEEKLGEYTMNGKKNQKDEEGKTREEYKKYSLRTLMASCTDFKDEKSAMEVLFEQLSTRGQNQIHLLTSPKYHCELAGEGIEYSWGLAKKKYRNSLLKKKKVRKISTGW